MRADVDVSHFPPITSARSYREQDACIAAAIRSVAALAGSRIEILEAGCGNQWPIDLHDVEYRLTGADLDEDALKLRIARLKDLDVALVGDLCTMVLPRGTFDVVYSSYVLEHIREADLALNNMVSALRPGGCSSCGFQTPAPRGDLSLGGRPFGFMSSITAG